MADCVAKTDVMSKLGAGTYGNVFQVSVEGKEYALKTYKSHAFEPGNIIEIDILTRVDHPNVIKAYKATVSEGCNVCLFLEIADTDLEKYLKTQTITPGVVGKTQASIMYGMACGLRYLHANYIVHSDLKPSNVLMIGDTLN